MKHSTCTIIVYYSGKIDFVKLFDYIIPTKIQVPLTKKQKNANKKRIIAPIGTILSVRYLNLIKGADISKKKKVACRVCFNGDAKENPELDDPGKIKTFFKSYPKDAKEITARIPSRKASGKPHPDGDSFDMYEWRYYCDRCQREYTYEEMGIIPNFKNQVSIYMSVTPGPPTHIMIFKNKMKIAGGRYVDNDRISPAWTKRFLELLWGGYISTSGAFTPTNGVAFGIIPVMLNFDFNIGFNVDKDAVMELFEKEEFAGRVASVFRDSTQTSNTNVNIKMFNTTREHVCSGVYFGSPKSSQRTKTGVLFKYIVSQEDLPKKKVLVKKNKKGSEEDNLTTFIVFSSGKTIISGGNIQSIQDNQNYFIEVVNRYRSILEEKINPKVINIDDLINVEGGPPRSDVEG